MNVLIFNRCFAVKNGCWAILLKFAQACSSLLKLCSIMLKLAQACSIMRGQPILANLNDKRKITIVHLQHYHGSS